MNSPDQTSNYLYLLFAIAGGAAISYTFIEVAPFLNWIRSFQVKHKVWVKKHVDVVYENDWIKSDVWYSPRRIKPFDCLQCLAFWCAIILFFFIGESPILQAFTTGCISVAIISLFIQRRK